MLSTMSCSMNSGKVVCSALELSRVATATSFSVICFAVELGKRYLNFAVSRPEMSGSLMSVLTMVG